MRSYLKDLEHENFLLKSTLLNLKMGVMNEKDKRRAEKKEMIREKELLEGMAVVKQKLKDLEIGKRRALRHQALNQTRRNGKPQQRKVWEVTPLSAEQFASASFYPDKTPPAGRRSAVTWVLFWALRNSTWWTTTSPCDGRGEVV
ncbi:hypothetical protein SRHO_G00110540 [Serrasalmus rhombeus]